MGVIALCLNLPIEDGSWRDKSFGKRYPGAGYLKHMIDGPHRIMAGKQVLEHIQAIALPPSEVIVIQEENNPIGQELIELGADARVNYCMESPIYASAYYDNPPKGFKHYLRFNGGTDHLFFPSFDDEDITDPVPWSDRKFLCMVMANKHYTMLPDKIRCFKSDSFEMAMKTQLHDYRYEAINHFVNCNDFDLYGKGWNQFKNHKIKGECSDKLSTIRNYKFALCFENGSYPGYITEKIIDCLVAGVIPLYRGAPDIDKYIPRKCFIDANDFNSFEHMEKTLREAHWDYEYIIKRGQDWLRSPEGQKYNNRVFAKRMLELCAD